MIACATFLERRGNGVWCTREGGFMKEHELSITAGVKVKYRILDDGRCVDVVVGAGERSFLFNFLHGQKVTYIN